MTKHRIRYLIQIKTFLTRIGQGSKFIVNGDLLQTDIHHENGLEDSIKRLVGVRGLGMSRFTSKILFDII